MKSIKYVIIAAILFSSCVYSTGDFPPEFCDISQSKIIINPGKKDESARCGDASVTYGGVQGNYRLEINSSSMVPEDNGADQPCGIRLTITSAEPLKPGDNLEGKDWSYGITWYDYYFYEEVTEDISFRINADSTVTAHITMSADIQNFQFEAAERVTFDMKLRNVKVPLF